MGNSDPTEFSSLIQQAKDGSEQAVGTLIGSVRTYLLMVANRELDAALRPKAAASDLVQEACLKATQKFSSFRGTTDGELRAWLRQVLLNSLSDSRKKFHQSQKRQISKEVNLEGRAIIPTRELSPHTSLIAREESDQLNEAISRLPEDYRRVIELRNWELHSFEHIGKQLNRSADAAQKLWTRAVHQLQVELGNSEPKQ